MKKIKLLTLLFTALLVSGSVWGAGDITASDDATAVTNGAVCKIGDQYYLTLQAAVNDAIGDQPIQIDMLKNVELTSFVSFGATNNVILELSGKAISCNNSGEDSGVLKVNGGNLVINDLGGNGSIICTGREGNAISIGGGVVVINGGIFKGTYEGIHQFGGKLTINGGEFSTSYDNAIWAKGANSELLITGGSFSGAWVDAQIDQGIKAEISGGVFNCTGDQTLAIGCWAACTSCVISGGTFECPTEATIFYPVKGPLEITGGRFKGKNWGVTLPTGKSISEPDEEGYCTVQENVVAILNGKNYPSVSDALIDAKANDIITLNSNSEEETIICGVSVIFNLAIYSIDGKLVVDGADVQIKGSKLASIGDFEVKNSGTLKIFGGTYSTDPSQYLAEGYMIIPNTTYTVGCYVAQIGETKYFTLNSAINAAGNTPSIITMINNTEVEQTITIGNGQNITLELNGKRVSLSTFANKDASLIFNYGNLTINDNSEQRTGILTTTAYGPDLAPVPGYGNWTISNRGTLNVLSGTIENTGEGAACQAIDNYANGQSVSLFISGGYITANAMSIRMYLDDVYDNDVTITGGVIKSFWVQDNDTNGNEKGNLTLQNVTFTGAVKIGYIEVAENFHLSVENCTYDEFTYLLNPDSGTNTISVSGNIDGQFVMKVPHKILSDGIYNFKDKVCLGWLEHNEEIEGLRYKDYLAKGIMLDTINDQDNAPLWLKGYISPEAHLHGFYDYIVDGYGLIPIEGRPMTYRIGKTQKSTEEPAPGHDPDLGNPWHQDKTWDVSKTDVVPTDTNAVQIDHPVYVEPNTIATAGSVQIKSDQILTVKTGATLMVGDGGIRMEDETAQIVVEPDAVLTVGSNGVIADDVENIIIQSTETKQGIFMVAPEVTVNTEPKARVELYTECKQTSHEPYEYRWQRFAIPTKDGSQTTYSDNFLTSGAELYDEKIGFASVVYGWSDDSQDWYKLSSWKQMNPFKGYQLTNNTKGGVTYYFEGDLVGNHNGEYAFVVEGFHFFGNSYTAPIYIRSFLDEIIDQDNGVEPTLWIYDVKADNFKPVTNLTCGKVKYQDGTKITEVRSMQAFIMNTVDATATSTLDYAAAIWGNPRYNQTASAPARKQSADFDMATIKVTAMNGQSDEVHLFQGNEFNADFDKGADASKYIYAGGINLYANTEMGKLSDVATNDLDETKLSFAAGKSTEYTISFDDVTSENLTLVDMVTNNEISVAPGAEYTFVQNANTTIDNRFMVKASRGIYTNIKSAKDQVSISKVMEDGQLYIVKDGTRYNAVGQMIK